MKEIAKAVSETPDHVLRQEAIDRGEDPDQKTSRVREVLLAAIRTHQQQHLKKAGEQYRVDIERLKRRAYRLPTGQDERRRILERVLALKPRMLPASLTAQHRHFRDVADADVESYLRQLEELGVLDELDRRDTGV